jgi:RNA polymerase sigma-32 factor
MPRREPPARPRKSPAARAAPGAREAGFEPGIEPGVEPGIEPGVEPVDDDGDGAPADELADLGELAAQAPEPDEDLDEGGPVLDVDMGGALVRRSAVALPEGEWVRDEGPDVGADEERVPAARGDDLYNAFVREATRLPRLSEEEERALGLRVRDHQDKAAARKLVVHNLRLAIKMAHQYRRTWTNLMDLVQEASAGMAIAAQRWDPDQGTRFGTYAVYWIRAQLTKFLMTHGRAIHTGNTRAGRKLYFQLPRVRRKLLAEGKEPSVENIAAEVQEDPLEVARIVARLDGREASLDAQVGQEDDGSTLGDMLANEDRGPEHHAARLEVQQVIEKLMERFAETLDNERDRAIWQEHLVAAEPRSLVELGARYGVSKQRMGQLATRIKRAFRRHVIEELGPTTQLHWLFTQE